MGGSLRGSGSNPWLGLGPEEPRASGLRAFSPLKRTPELASVYAGGGSAVLSTGSSEPPAPVSCDRLRRALAGRLRGPGAASEDELKARSQELLDADLESWDGRVHSIASAYNSDLADRDGSGRLTPAARAKAPQTWLLEEGIYLGDATCAREVGSREFARQGISAVLNCGAPFVEYPPEILHSQLQCEDTEGYPLLARHLDECLTFIEKCEAEHKGLLLHCVMGLNRSTAVAVAFLVLNRRVPLLEAVGRVWRVRGGLPILTNRSFRLELICLAHMAGLLGRT